MRRDDGHREQYFEQGCFSEERGWAIWHNAFCEYPESPKPWDTPPCKHCGPFQVERMSSGEQLRGFRVPRMVFTTNQGGHDCTGVCADCIAEAVAEACR